MWTKMSPNENRKSNDSEISFLQNFLTTEEGVKLSGNNNEIHRNQYYQTSFNGHLIAGPSSDKKWPVIERPQNSMSQRWEDADEGKP